MKTRDNFGEEIGLLSANYRWNVGDRTSILANAYYDLFDSAQELWNVGYLTQRGSRGSLYLGLRQVKGSDTDLDSRYAIASFSYMMSPKWVSTFGTSYDLARSRNRGHSFTVTRIGADFLLHLGFKYNESKGNTGIALLVEPRFGGLNSSSRIGSLMRGMRRQ